MLQVNYSQCLGVIGYSLIPLVLTAAALPLVHYFPAISFAVKVNAIVHIQVALNLTMKARL